MVVFQGNDFLQFLLLGGCGMVLKEMIFYSFYFRKVVVVLKDMILTVSTLGGCSALERTDF